MSFVINCGAQKALFHKKKENEQAKAEINTAKKGKKEEEKNTACKYISKNNDKCANVF